MAEEKEVIEKDEVLEEEETTKSKKKKKIIIFGGIGAAVFLVIIGVAVFFVLSGKSSSSSSAGAALGEHGGESAVEGQKTSEKDAEKADKKEAGAKEGQSEKKGEGGAAKGDKEGKGEEGKTGAGKDRDAEKNDVGRTVDLGGPFSLNLGNPLENRYVRLSIAIEVTNEDMEKDIKRRNAQMRDAVISIVSRKTMEFLLSPDGKDELRKEIKDKINGYISKPINRVFITDILIE